MQTGLAITTVNRPERVERPGWSLRRAIVACRHWFGSYELGSDEKIRRFTGAR